MSIAAVLVLGAGVIIGRTTAPRPWMSSGFERFAGVCRRLAQARRAREHLGRGGSTPGVRPGGQRGEPADGEWRNNCGAICSSVRPVHDRFGTTVEKKLAEFVRLIEEARLKDRQQVAKALDRIEQNRVRDKTQIGIGLQYVAALTAKATPAIQH